MAKSSRMLVVLSLLQARRDWPARALAERLAISERTVRRDVDRLRELGYRIRAIKGPDGGYRLDAGAELPPLLFDDDQAIALAVALQAASGAGSGLEEPALRALAAVRQVLPARLRQRVDALRFTAVTDSSRPPLPIDPDVLLAVSSAVRAEVILRFDYASPEPSESPDARAPLPPRQTEPHHLVARGGRWYLVAWDLDRSDWRIFRVDRMTPRTPTGRRFSPRDLPGGDVRTFVAARFKGSESEDAWPCRGDVILHLPAREVAEYLPTATLEELGPERCRLRVGAWSWAGLAATIGRFDADVEVVGPPELAAAFTDLAGRFARAGAGYRP
ncbi:DeoR family transcriptional regulator [Frondihabitans sucicola]|uniref:DeoR family transcriptional regulator n=1 Tax=Frondihabitans sucicola TaxID=1268041 RepID=A0ABN6Y7N4_9MICO|nr:WYL domain-containing protein [Frondihabitans sucicola]BDZ52157.1 DeoR family transcriptional regulator [Frondihabitans sucicola]